MQRVSRILAGWRGIGLVAITYIYFLIFAQFGFLKRLAELEIEDAHLKAAMAAMAAGGILFSLLAPRLPARFNPALLLQIAFGLCGSAALLSSFPLPFAGGIAVSFLIGSGLGLLTVTLVTFLGLWLDAGDELVKVGIGTGIGYLFCNIPELFTATPQHQAYAAAVLCLAGIVIAANAREEEAPEDPAIARSAMSFPLALLCFTALVWLDSAAFFIIQSTPVLKAGSWQGSLHLWSNGLLHLVAAVLSAWLLQRRGLSFTLSAAFLALGGACLLLLDPHRVLLASIFYPVGVSLYSVALVAYPASLSSASTFAERGRRAGWIYAIAGWAGSALGIGMGQNLGHVPIAFVVCAGAIVLATPLAHLFRKHPREIAATVATLVAALGLYAATQSPQPALSQVERGRQVYIEEGCIHCHSQYVRPNSSDVLLWGPVQGVEALRQQHPPLIGNRRQGPDLAEVGARRSALWMKMHFYNPAELSHHSFMPSYSYLFAPGGRGEDLVAYLQSLGSPEQAQHRVAEEAWHLDPHILAHSDLNKGPRLFEAYCATCHAANGLTRSTWRSEFKRTPPDLMTGPFLHLATNGTPEAELTQLAQIVKFGLPGTDMPGHEYLPDAEIASLSLWLDRVIPQPQPNETTPQRSRRTTMNHPLRKLSLFLPLLFAVSASAERQTLSINPDTSNVSFTLGGSGHETKGSFHVDKGTIQFDPKTSHIEGLVVVAAGSGKTGNDSRDKKMTTEVLDATHFAEVTFVPTAFTGAIAPTGDSTVQVTGTFTLHGTPHELTVPMQLHIDGSACTAKTSFVVPYVKWGLKDPSIFILKVAKEVNVDLTLSGTLSPAR
jgi:cytochrome c oxidase cbb3-type subunit 2